MTHLALAFGFIGTLYAIKCALAYDLSSYPAKEHALWGPATDLWKTNMAAWKLANGTVKGTK